MKAIIQRVKSAQVDIEGKTVGKIGNGFLILLGVRQGDDERHAKVLADKISVLRIFTDENDKMNLSLKDIGGSALIISNFMYTPKYGDIVVISHGEKYDDPIIKRVIATEGQALSINYTTGEVSVDGVILDEPYIKGKTIKLRHPLDIPDRIPKGYVFVMGDNREGSLDCRSTEIGLIPVENIIGKAEWRIFPFNTIGYLY